MSEHHRGLIVPRLLVLVLPLASVSWSQATDLNPEQAKAVAAIRKLGGDVRIHEGTTTRVAPGEEWRLYGGINAWEHLKQVDPRVANPGEVAVSVEFTHGSIPAAALERLKNLPSLRTLSLTQVEIPRAGLSQLAKLPQLQSLDLCCAKIGDDEIKELEGLAQLKVLDISCTKVTNAGLEHLRGLTGLRWLSIAQTKVTDAGLAGLNEMSQLQDLNLAMLDVSDAGLEHLKG